MNVNVKKLQNALNVLELPAFVTFKEIRVKYRELSKRYHPDIYGDDSKMLEINEAYELIKEYVENFRFSFDEEEINKQFPESYHAHRFRF